MAPDSPKRSDELVCLALDLEDLIYMEKIEKLANEKLDLFVCELEKEKESKKTKGTSKHQHRSTVKVVPKKVVGKLVVTNEVTERLKEFVTNEMNGLDMKLVIQKFLFGSDLSDGQNRLNIPINQVKKHEFLTIDEKQFLESDVKNEIEVRVLGPRLRMFEETMGLKIWRMSTTKNYVLKGKYWSKFVNDNKDDLKVNTNIQVWSFRKERQLYLAIVCVD